MNKSVLYLLFFDVTDNLLFPYTYDIITLDKGVQSLQCNGQIIWLRSCYTFWHWSHLISWYVTEFTIVSDNLIQTPKSDHDHILDQWSWSRFSLYEFVCDEGDTKYQHVTCGKGNSWEDSMLLSDINIVLISNIMVHCCGNPP